MRLPLHVFLTRLGVPGLQWDDVEPLSLFDERSRLLYVAEVRLCLEQGEFLQCEIAHVTAREQWRSLLQVRAEPDDGSWTVSGVTVSGRPAKVDHDAAFQLACAAMADLRARRSPYLGAKVFAQLGVTIPNKRYR